MIPKPVATYGQIRETWMEENDDFELVQENFDRDDHGYAYQFIFKRLSDETYWQVRGKNQGDGEYDSLRDDCAPGQIGYDDPALQVYPHIVTKTIFKTKPSQT